VNPVTGDPAPVRLRTGSARDTRALGMALAQGLRAGDVVVLAGDLGAGKTTLAQGIGAGLGVADHVTSPTFTLVRSYPCAPATATTTATTIAITTVDEDRSNGRGAATVRTFLHADLYRLEHLGEVADLALAELVEDDAVAVVEWGDVATPVLGGDGIEIRLAEGEAEDERSVTISVTGSARPRRDELSRLLARWATS
jgi:tRNA threonylcarbamoyladenosine biosynthesis protein TsaE